MDASPPEQQDRASSAPPSYDDTSPLRAKLARAKARHAPQSDSTAQPAASSLVLHGTVQSTRPPPGEGVPPVPPGAGKALAPPGVGEPTRGRTLVPLGAGESRPKSLGAAKSKSQGRPPGQPVLGRMTSTRPREDCSTTDCVRVDAAGEDPGMAFQTVETDELDEVLGMEKVKLVLLPFFDGIGAAHVALANLGVTPCFAMSFGTDEECKPVVHARFPAVETVGSYDTYTAEERMDSVKEATKANDDLVILVTAGPLCPDFSRIKGSTSKGRTGPEGEKFVKFCSLLNSLRAAAHARGWGVPLCGGKRRHEPPRKPTLRQPAGRPGLRYGRRRHDVCLPATLLVDKLPRRRGVGPTHGQEGHPDAQMASQSRRGPVPPHFAHQEARPRQLGVGKHHQRLSRQRRLGRPVQAA